MMRLLVEAVGVAVGKTWWVRVRESELERQ